MVKCAIATLNDFLYPGDKLRVLPFENIVLHKFAFIIVTNKHCIPNHNKTAYVAVAVLRFICSRNVHQKYFIKKCLHRLTKGTVPKYRITI